LGGLASGHEEFGSRTGGWPAVTPAAVMTHGGCQCRANGTLFHVFSAA